MFGATQRLRATDSASCIGLIRKGAIRSIVASLLQAQFPN